MTTENISGNIAKATVHYLDRNDDIAQVTWVEHPKFKGVYLKNMIKGADTGDLFSAHLIKISPFCSLQTHCHEQQLELHEVLDGEGIFQLNEKRFDYHLGKMSVIPKGEMHSVQAGENGLVLLAKFFPASL